MRESTTHVVHLTCSTFFGGPERQILGLCSHLPPRYQSSIVVFSELGRSDMFQKSSQSNGIMFRIISDNLVDTIRIVQQLTSILIDLDPDILCCHGYKANLVGLFSARILGIPCISVFRGWTSENWKVKLFERIDKIVLSQVKTVVCLSKRQLSIIQHGDSPFNRVKVVSNAASLHRYNFEKSIFRAELSKLFPFDPQLIFCAAGRLSPEKGYDDLVRAARIVINVNPQIGFVLFGDGVLRSRLQSVISRFNLRDHFILAGFSDQLDRIMSACDAIIISSYSEGIPNILLESFAAGIPVLGTRVGGIPELIIEGVNGFLVHPGDFIAMADRIILIARSVLIRHNLGVAGRRYVKYHYSFATQADRYQDIFREVLRSVC